MGTISNKRKAELLDLFKDLPEKRTDRNKYNYNTSQIIAIKELRRYFTPKEIEKLTNISVYKIHKIVNTKIIVIKKNETDEQVK